MNLLAPLTCSADYPTRCGSPIRVLDETWMADFDVFTARLVCDAGHDWLDMRDAKTVRKHPWVGPTPTPVGQLSLFAEEPQMTPNSP